jgi:hypothetical protein
VSDLKTFVALQARLYEFLDRQDEVTLQALVSGTRQLAVIGAAEGPPPVSVVPFPRPSTDPSEVAHDLAKLTEEERRKYLDSANFVVSDLRKVARELRLRGYHKLTKPKLLDLITGRDSGIPPTEPPPPPLAERPVAISSAPPATARPDVDAAAIASHLREIETEEEGAAYLEAQNLDRESLLAVAAELQLTRVNRLSQKELRRRVLKQAIGARRKFAGLRKW